MAAIPYARVAYLLQVPQSELPAYMQPRSWRKSPTNGPKTLTGDPHGLSSYELTIAYRDGDDWLVYADDNSQTTNRHVKAARAVIEGMGYRPIEEHIIVKGGWNRHAYYQRFRRA